MLLCVVQSFIQRVMLLRVLWLLLVSMSRDSHCVNWCYWTSNDCFTHKMHPVTFVWFRYLEVYGIKSTVHKSSSSSLEKKHIHLVSFCVHQHGTKINHASWMLLNQLSKFKHQRNLSGYFVRNPLIKMSPDGYVFFLNCQVQTGVNFKQSVVTRKWQSGKSLPHASYKHAEFGQELLFTI